MIQFTLLGALLLDQVSKVLILRRMSFNESLPVLPPFFHLTLVGNTGIAFGLFKGNSELFIVVGLLILFWIALLFRKGHLQDPWSRAGLGLVSGGALGNLVDRFHYGYVVDFLDFRIWPVFNIADLCISVGAVLFLITCFKK